MQSNVNATTACGLALRFLRRNLEVAWSVGERLPTTEQLASMAGVARGTMAKAVSVLVREGRLSALRRRGIVVGPGLPSQIVPLPPRPLQKWERLKRRIEFDLYDGDFHKLETLPAAKQLQTRYGVDFRTLKKALEQLSSQGVLRLHKRVYRVARVEESLRENAVVYVTPTELYNVKFRSYPEAGDMVRLLESECGRRKLSFRPVATNDNELFRRAVRDYRSLGGLFYHSGQYPREIFEEFSSLRKPMAMFDNYNHAQNIFTHAYLQKNRMRVFQFDEIYAGEEVGRFLLRLGHRRVAFISPFHGDWVYPLRFEAIRRSFESAGVSNAVELVCENNIRENLQKHASEILERRAAKSKTTQTADGLTQELVELGLTEGSDEILINWATESQSWNIDPSHVYNVILFRELQSLFERALALDGVSAWVCANDGVGIHALRFLRNHRIAVPSRLSVVAFDNTGDASYNDLASYDFDVSAIALKMIDHILRPDSGLFPAEVRVNNSTGMVIPRASAGKPGEA